MSLASVWLWLVGLNLVAGPGVTWAKEIHVLGKDGAKLGVLRTEDKKTVSGYQIFLGTKFESDRVIGIQFWKASSFGIMIQVGAALIDFQDVKGKNIEFIWDKD